MRIPLLILGLSLAAAAPAEVVVVEEIVAKVNGDVILRSDYHRVLEDLQAEVNRDPRLSEEQKQEQLDERTKNVLRDLIDERLLVQKGENLGVSVEAQVLRQREELMKQYELETIDEFERWASERAGMAAEDLLDRMRENFLTQAVIGQEVGARIVITREEVESYYNEHKDEFVRSEGVRLSEILISKEGMTGEQLEEAEKTAGEVHARVRRGEPFAEMARRFSDSEFSKEAGGDIGIFRKGQLRSDIEEEVFSNNPGYITDLMETDRGWLILKITDRYHEGLAELEEVQDEIRQKLMAPRYAPAIRDYLTQLREYGYIEIRPGYVDAAAAPGKDTSWTDPATLAPDTTTREEVLEGKKKRRLLWFIPLPGGDDNDDEDAPEEAEAPKSSGVS